MKTLSPPDRQRLLRFVCAFAWADLEIHPEERAYLQGLIGGLGVTPAEAEMVDAWLQVPPRPEEVDPMEIPDEHKRLFLDTARGMIESDGEREESESELLSLLEQLLA